MDEAVNQRKASMVGVSDAVMMTTGTLDENLRLGNRWDGIEVYAGLLADLIGR